MKLTQLKRGIQAMMQEELVKGTLTKAMLRQNLSRPEKEVDGWDAKLIDPLLDQETRSKIASENFKTVLEFADEQFGRKKKLQHHP